MLIAANLDVEVTWARIDAAGGRPGDSLRSPDDPRFALPEPVMRKISAAGTLLRAFAQADDDVLWTPRPVDPSRMAKVAWMPKPRLVSGPVPKHADVWWGEPTEAAARAGHRRFVLDARAAAGCPADAEIVWSVDGLREHAASVGPWVAKAPYSAAGRDRVRGDRGPLAEPALRQAERLLEVYGCLLFEPWLARRRDLGVAVSQTGREITAHEPHDLLVDAAGRFTGIRTPSTADDPAVERARTIAFEVCGALKRLGFEGDFGIDLFEVACPGVAPSVHLCEVNARRTFGHVAAELARRARTAGRSETGVLTLRFGRSAPPSGTIPLLQPGADDDTSAWLEESPRHAG
jgi:hypothetical protein